MGATARWGRLGLLAALLAAAVVVAARLPPIPQDPSYHLMADARTLGGIPNACNVVSNVAFVLVGAAGLWSVGPGRRGAWGVSFIEARERWPYVVFFAGLFLTGLGSAYYHLAPGNERLMWDRLPLAVTLMGLFAGAIAERVGPTTGLVLLGPLAGLGIASVLTWYAGEARGAGDLRLYGLVQFFPLVAIPVMAMLFPARYTRGSDLLVAAAIYAAAKLGELLDARIYEAAGVLSGHTVKHVAAALSGCWVWRMLMARRPA